MDGKEAIINKIISDANAEAQAILTAAEEAAATQVEAAEEAAKKNHATLIAAAEKNAGELIARRITVADLDVKKLYLNAKKDVIDKVFARAYDKLLALPEKDYKALVAGMIEAYADDGDEVTVSKKDKGVITAAFIADVAKKKGVKLSLSGTYGDFTGGVILSGNGVDKNLTLEVELKLLREELETEVAATLFKE